jgi:hypothetical protein
MTQNTRYVSAFKALESLEGGYAYWSSKITETSVQLSFALIAANWAVHGSDALKTELLPRISVACAFLGLMTTLITANCLTKLIDKRQDYAEEDPSRWEAEWQNSQTQKDPWPYTRAIERVGEISRCLRFWFPILGAIFLGFSFV